MSWGAQLVRPLPTADGSGDDVLLGYHFRRPVGGEEVWRLALLDGATGALGRQVDLAPAPFSLADAPPGLVDLDGDGRKEVILAYKAGGDWQLLAMAREGEVLWQHQVKP